MTPARDSPEMGGKFIQNQWLRWPSKVPMLARVRMNHSFRTGGTSTAARENQ
jgi:hypothetical protein